MGIYDLKLTKKQAYLIQYHIYELCNHRFRNSIDDYTIDDFKIFDDYDVLRTNIYFKEHRLNKSYVIFKGLTDKEIKFIGSELDYWCRDKGDDMEPEDRRGIQMAKRVNDNIKKTLDIQHQRNSILERILR